MEVYEKINYLLQEKQLSKKEFANKLISITPQLKRTGEVPSEQTILGYLYGKREIKIELIPYIAEVLGVDEGELFRFDIEYASNYNQRYSKQIREIIELLRYVPSETINELIEKLHKYKTLHEDATKI